MGTTLLPPALAAASELWGDLDEALSTILTTEVRNHISELADYHNIDRSNISRNDLIHLAKYIGWQFKDTGLFTDKSLLQFCRSANYLPNKGTPQFEDFIAYILNSYLTIYNLWTTDYLTFYREFKLVFTLLATTNPSGLLIGDHEYLLQVTGSGLTSESTILKYTTTSRVDLKLTWELVTNATSYNLFKKIDNIFVRIYTGTGQTFTDTFGVTGSVLPVDVNSALILNGTATLVGTLPYGNGTYYLTSHVDLAVDVSDLTSQGSISSDINNLVSSIFYAAAPLQLVLRALDLAFTVSGSLGFGGQVATHFQYMLESLTTSGLVKPIYEGQYVAAVGFRYDPSIVPSIPNSSIDGQKNFKSAVPSSKLNNPVIVGPTSAVTDTTWSATSIDTGVTFHWRVSKYNDINAEWLTERTGSSVLITINGSTTPSLTNTFTLHCYTTLDTDPKIMSAIVKINITGTQSNTVLAYPNWSEISPPVANVDHNLSVRTLLNGAASITSYLWEVSVDAGAYVQFGASNPTASYKPTTIGQDLYYRLTINGSIILTSPSITVL